MYLYTRNMFCYEKYYGKIKIITTLLWGFIQQPCTRFFKEQVSFFNFNYYVCTFWITFSVAWLQLPWKKSPCGILNSESNLLVIDVSYDYSWHSKNSGNKSSRRKRIFISIKRWKRYDTITINYMILFKIKLQSMVFLSCRYCFNIKRLSEVLRTTYPISFNHWSIILDIHYGV